MQESDAQSNTPAGAQAPKRSRIKRSFNWKLIGVEFIGGGLGFYAFVTRAPRLPGFAGVVIGAICLWLVYRECRGLTIKKQTLFTPTDRLRWLPILSFGRTEIPLDAVQELTVTSPWLGFEVVQITGDVVSEVLVFQSRGQRRRFMAALEESYPDIQMFRTTKPGAE
jgi:hypothetical protein